MSRYVDDFLTIKSAPDILGTVGYLGNKPGKEISEAWAIIKRLRNETLNHAGDYQLVDLCSGNALVPVIAAHLLPVTHSFAVDKLERKRNWSNARNFTYIQSDINDLLPSLFNKPTILTGVHCCSSAAAKVIKIFNSNENIKHMLLMTCCIGNLDSPILQFIKGEANRDVAWVTKLALQCKGKVRISRDKYVLSPKNFIISAWKN